MSMNTWSQYVAMDDPLADTARLDTILELDGWEDDFELGEVWDGESLAANDD